MKTEKDMSKEYALITEKTSELSKRYPREAAYGTRSNLWLCALKDGVVSQEMVDKAKAYYGRMWNYVGD